MSTASPPTHRAFAEAASPQAAEIVSGGRRFPLRNVRFGEVRPGTWEVEFSVAVQPEAMSLIEIVRGGRGSLLLSIDGGPVVGAHSRLRPRYQTILSQPMRYEFLWP